MPETLGVAISHDLVTAAVVDNSGKAVSYHTVDMYNDHDSTAVAAIQAILGVIKRRPDKIVISCSDESQEWTIQSELSEQDVSWRDSTLIINHSLALTEFVKREPRLLKYDTVGFAELDHAGRLATGNSICIIDISRGAVLQSGDPELLVPECFHNGAPQVKTSEGVKALAITLDDLADDDDQPDLLLLCGEGANDESIKERLTHELEIPIHTMPEPKYAIAIGAAHKSIGFPREDYIDASPWKTAIILTIVMIIFLLVLTLIGYLILRRPPTLVPYPSSVSTSSSIPESMRSDTPDSTTSSAKPGSGAAGISGVPATPTPSTTPSPGATPPNGAPPSGTPATSLFTVIPQATLPGEPRGVPSDYMNPVTHAPGFP